MSQSLDRPVQIHLLGEFQLTVEGVDKTPLIAYSKPKLLLALLALSLEKKQARAVLAELLWPNGATGARANLRHALCVLRQVLGPMEKAVLTTSSTLALNKDLVTVDVLALCGIGPYAKLGLEERLRYDRGELLEHMVTPINAGLSAWRMSWQSRLSQEVSQCRQAYIQHLCESGAIQEALDSARQWVQVHPGDEHAHRDLIRLLRDSGRREAAMKAYEHCVAVMGEYYGTGPSAETRSLLDVTPGSERAVHAPLSGNVDARPLAVLAIAVGPVGDSMPVEETLDHVQKARRRIIRLAQAAGRRVCLGADGNLAILFGYPTLNERAAESAARLACLIQRFGVTPQVSVGMGIHADLACVPPDNGALPMMLVGQRALRLAYLAESGETLVTDSAQARLSDRFAVRCDQRYGLRVGLLEGQSQGITVHRMFGRTIEFDILVRRWNSLRGGARPHVMYLRGEQGIGKTLLAQVFAEYVRRGGGAVVSLRCDQENRHMALHPFHEYLLHRLAAHDAAHDGAHDGAHNVAHDPPHDPAHQDADIAGGDDGTSWCSRAMESLGYRIGLDKAASASLADHFVTLRGAAMGGGANNVSAASLFGPLATLLLHVETPGQPVLLMVDDAQWADDATRSLLRALLLQARQQPVMMLLCGRDLDRALPVDETITMPPLRRDAMVQLVSFRSKDTRLSPKLRRRIVEQARGVPLYAEQMVRRNPTDVDDEPTPLILDLLAARAMHEREDEADTAISRTHPELSMPFLEAD
jgi:DNA-binding SARP family transcriptional activator